MNFDGYLTTGQAARLLGISQVYLGRLIRRGRLEALPTPLGNLLSKATLEQFQQERDRR